MGARLIRAAALVAVSAMSIGVAPASVAAKEIAAPSASPLDAPAARRQVMDPAVAHLATEKGLSTAEAQRRIDVQQRAPILDEALAETLGPVRYGGVWIGDDDRIKVGIVEPETESAVRAAAAVHQLAGETDLVPVRHSLAALLLANNWLADQVIPANVNANSAMVTGYTTAGNTVRLGLPPETGLTSSQRAVLHEARKRFGSMLSTYTYAGRSKPEADCGRVNDRFACDPPLRGGVRIFSDAHGCTLGFLARSRIDNKLFGITAGHCFEGENIAEVWFTSDNSGAAMRLGTRHNSEYGPAGDVGIINIANPLLRDQIAACRCSWVLVLASPDTPSTPGTALNERYPILRDGTSEVGMRVCHTGAVTGTSCGRVTLLGVTSESGVRNLAEANYCGDDGDSGGPVYAGNTAYGLHHGGPGYCIKRYQGIRGAEDLMRVDVVFDKAPTPGVVHFRHNKDQLSLRKYNFYRPDGQLCQYRVRYGDFGNAAYAQVRLYGGACGGTGVEVYGRDFAESWRKDHETAGQQDACGPYIEIQATSSSGHSAAGMAVVTPDGNRIYYSHNYTDRPFNDEGPICN